MLTVENAASIMAAVQLGQQLPRLNNSEKKSRRFLPAWKSKYRASGASRKSLN
jgi:hypothetical protein